MYIDPQATRTRRAPDCYHALAQLLAASAAWQSGTCMIDCSVHAPEKNLDACAGKKLQSLPKQVVRTGDLHP